MRNIKKYTLTLDFFHTGTLHFRVSPTWRGHMLLCPFGLFTLEKTCMTDMPEHSEYGLKSWLLIKNRKKG